jgi:hypothetical protein
LSIAVVLLTLILLAVVIAVVSRPLLAERTRRDTHGHGRRAATPQDEPLGAQPGGLAPQRTSDEHPADGPASRCGAVPDVLRREELEAAREAKYREIRDTELDYRTGKLSSEDYEAVNGALRVEAVEILDQLEALEEQGRARDGADGPARGGPSGPSTRVS